MTTNTAHYPLQLLLIYIFLTSKPCSVFSFCGTNFGSTSITYTGHPFFWGGGLLLSQSILQTQPRISSLLLLPCSLWPGLVAPDRVLFMARTNLLKNYSYSKQHIKCKNERYFLTSYGLSYHWNQLIMFRWSFFFTVLSLPIAVSLYSSVF